jgi:hypothetical protein
MRINPIVQPTICGFLLLCLGLLSCDEELPPYEPPENVLRAELSLSDSRVDRLVSCGSGNKTWNLDPIIFQISVINVFDETLQGPANRVSGKLDVWRKDDPDFGKTFLINGAIDPQHVRNNVLTLDPGDTLKIGVVWLHDNDANQRIWKYYSQRSLAATIRARAQIKVFQETPTLFPADFELNVNYDVETSQPPCNQ